MKLLMTLCDALGFEVEKTCVNEDERQRYIRAGAVFDPERVYEYKLTKRDDAEHEDAELAAIAQFKAGHDYQPSLKAKD